ncbi:MAG: hypothetical protein GY804_10125 [Alphaproteobacteria bacterium]|nr:hypothetical protein [Alphaproteobacteria bacterium]
MFKSKKLHAQTVRKWLKNGLQAIDSKKPLLIYGYNLKEYLGKLNDGRKIDTMFDEFYCFSCKLPEIPYKRNVCIEQNGSYIKAKGICPNTKKEIRKNYKLTDFQKLKKAFNLTDELELYDSADPSLKTHIQHHNKNCSNESRQLRLL